MTKIPDYVSATNGGAPARPRPTSVTVLATIGLILAAMMIACNAVSMLALVVGGQHAQQDPNPLTAAVRAEPALMRWHLVATVARMGVGFVLLIGSLGALALRRWGRWMMLGYAGVALVVSIADTVMTVKYMLPLVDRLAATDPNVQAIASKQHVGVPLNVFLSCAFPVLVLIFMNRRHVKDAFAGGGLHASGGIVPDRAGR